MKILQHGDGDEDKDEDEHTVKTILTKPCGRQATACNPIAYHPSLKANPRSEPIYLNERMWRQRERCPELAVVEIHPRGSGI